MTDRMFNNRIAKIMDLKSQIDELTEQLNDAKAEIQDFMAETGAEEVVTNRFKVISKVIASKSFDSKAFKKDHNDLYEDYCREIAKSYWKVSEVEG